MSVDVQAPHSSIPSQGTIEVAQGEVAVILQGCEDIAEVSITAGPPRSIQVIPAGDTQQIVEVDLVYCCLL